MASQYAGPDGASFFDEAAEASQRIQDAFPALQHMGNAASGMPVRPVDMVRRPGVAAGMTEPGGASFMRSTSLRAALTGAPVEMGLVDGSVGVAEADDAADDQLVVQPLGAAFVRGSMAEAEQEVVGVRVLPDGRRIVELQNKISAPTKPAGAGGVVPGAHPRLKHMLGRDPRAPRPVRQEIPNTTEPMPAPQPFDESVFHQRAREAAQRQFDMDMIVSQPRGAWEHTLPQVPDGLTTEGTVLHRHVMPLSTSSKRINAHNYEGENVRLFGYSGHKSSSLSSSSLSSSGLNRSLASNMGGDVEHMTRPVSLGPSALLREGGEETEFDRSADFQAAEHLSASTLAPVLSGRGPRQTESVADRALSDTIAVHDRQAPASWERRTTEQERAARIAFGTDGPQRAGQSWGSSERTVRQTDVPAWMLGPSFEGDARTGKEGAAARAWKQSEQLSRAQALATDESAIRSAATAALDRMTDSSVQARIAGSTVVESGTAPSLGKRSRLDVDRGLLGDRAVPRPTDEHTQQQPTAAAAARLFHDTSLLGSHAVRSHEDAIADVASSSLPARMQYERQELLSSLRQRSILDDEDAGGDPRSSAADERMPRDASLLSRPQAAATTSTTQLPGKRSRVGQRTEWIAQPRHTQDETRSAPARADAASRAWTERETVAVGRPHDPVSASTHAAPSTRVSDRTSLQRTAFDPSAAAPSSAAPGTTASQRALQQRETMASSRTDSAPFESAVQAPAAHSATYRDTTSQTNPAAGLDARSAHPANRDRLLRDTSAAAATRGPAPEDRTSSASVLSTAVRSVLDRMKSLVGTSRRGQIEETQARVWTDQGRPEEARFQFETDEGRISAASQSSTLHASSRFDSDASERLRRNGPDDATRWSEARMTGASLPNVVSSNLPVSSRMEFAPDSMIRGMDVSKPPPSLVAHVHEGTMMKAVRRTLGSGRPGARALRPSAVQSVDSESERE